jgi:hypothetical protein
LVAGKQASRQAGKQATFNIIRLGVMSMKLE